jgi:hypothetical protein
MMDFMIFKPAARYPADPRAVFILALSVFTALLALAFNFAPGSLESVLPRWGVAVWGALLGVGSVVTLAGMYFQTINGIIAEQVGSIMVGVTTIYYAVLAFWTVGGDAVQIVGIILAWGLACIVRWGQLQALLVQTAHRVQREAAICAADDVSESASAHRQAGGSDPR